MAQHTSDVSCILVLLKSNGKNIYTLIRTIVMLDFIYAVCIYNMELDSPAVYLLL